MSEVPVFYNLQTAGDVTAITGRLSDLETTVNTNLVAAINEIDGKFPVSVANGGTGNTSLTSGNILLGNGTDAITSTDVLSVAKGGTGQTSLTSGNILLGNGTDGVTSTDVLPISKGGTGATSAADIRSALSVMTGTSLWGSSSGTKSTINFTDNYANYDFIYIQGMDNGVATCNIFRPITTSQVSICNWYATAASNPMGMYYHGCYLSFSYSSSTGKTTVTFERNGTYTVKLAANTDDTWTVSSTAGIYITKIMGYKY